MSNTFIKTRQAKREKLKIPKSVQNAIPINKIYEDGIFRVGNNYSKTLRFTDINYRVASKDGQMDMLVVLDNIFNRISENKLIGRHTFIYR